MMVAIRILLAGGTIDKQYHPIKEATVFGQTHVFEMLEQARNRADVRVEHLFLKDSLDLTDADRVAILDRCKSVRDTRILILHGTSTMPKTGGVLTEDSSIREKTVVLTGAMVPFSLGKSDALFNLGFAMAAVQLLPSGVFIAMNGKIFTAGNVYKDEGCGEFRPFQDELEFVSLSKSNPSRLDFISKN